nr:coiled-coil domain-containing protein 93-like isoform X1 [Equus asinus]
MWLVKRAIETKEEMGDYIRSYSVSQFQKTCSLPEDDDFLKRKEKAVKTVVDLSDVYKPRRKYKRQQGAEELLDEESRIHATLLEYGRRYGFSRQSQTEKIRKLRFRLHDLSKITQLLKCHNKNLNLDLCDIKACALIHCLLNNAVLTKVVTGLLRSRVLQLQIY